MKHVYPRYLLAIWLTLFAGVCAVRGQNDVSNNGLRPRSLAVNGAVGSIFKTNDYVRMHDGSLTYQAVALKYALLSSGNKWEDAAYGMPYYGIGFYMPRFHDALDFGHPFSIFVFQGSTLWRLGNRLTINNEWNLGMSANWGHYDPFLHPTNTAIGTPVNVHVGLNLYLKWFVSHHFDLHLGANLTHFSNGSTRKPNSGINLGSVYLEAVYNFNRTRMADNNGIRHLPPPFRKRIDHDVLVNISTRQVAFDTTGTNLPSGYVERRFNILGLSYAAMYAPSYKHKYGLSADLLYDESSCARVWRQRNPRDGNTYERVRLGAVGRRISFGLSAKGELVYPGYSFFANAGFNLVHGNKADHRFYQIVGVKLFLQENLFGTFGIRANNFSRAQFLYWSLGYTFKGREFRHN